jgi:hypothetical protein
VLTFSDALGRYVSGMNEAELVEAYRRAGGAFKGQLLQNFVVLHEGHVYGGVVNIFRIAKRLKYQKCP